MCRREPSLVLWLVDKEMISHELITVSASQDILPLWIHVFVKVDLSEATNNDGDFSVDSPVRFIRHLPSGKLCMDPSLSAWISM